MKVLHVIPYYPPAFYYGGIVRTTHELCRELTRMGIELVVATTNINGSNLSQVPVNKEIIYDGVHVRYFPVQRINRWFYSKPLFDFLSKNIRHFHIIHVHGVFLFPTLSACYLAQRKNSVYILSPRGMIVDELIRRKNFMIKTPYINLIEKRNLLKASALHFTSELEKEQVLQYLTSIKKYFVLEHGVAPDAFSKSASDETINNMFPEIKGKKIILFLGRVNWKKGLDLLIPAFARISRENDNVHLMIAGPDDGYLSKAQQLVKKEEITRNVTFSGMLTGSIRVAFLKRSYAFVLPSYGENFAIAVLEAMCCGLPVIVSNKTGLYNKVASNQAGIVIENSIDNIYKSLNQLLFDEKMAQTMGRNGENLVRKHYLWPDIAKRLIKIYNELL